MQNEGSEPEEYEPGYESEEHQQDANYWRERRAAVSSFVRSFSFLLTVTRNDDQLGKLRREGCQKVPVLRALARSTLFLRAFDEEFQSEHEYLTEAEKQEAGLELGVPTYYVRQKRWLSPKASRVVGSVRPAYG